jgi:hypothetical protein
MVKERDQIVQQHNELLTTITSTGASADEFARMLGYMRAVHSDNLEDRRAAYQMVMAEMRGLAPLIGEVLPGEDPLAGHQDLIDAVAASTISQKHAEELAAARHRAAAMERTTQAQTEQQRATKEYDDAAAAARTELNALGAQLAENDPLYEQKANVIVEALKPVMAQLHPSRWKTAFQKAYDNVKLPAAVSTTATPKPGAKPGNGQQPLRVKTPAGQGQAAPKTMLEAINASLGGAK